MSATVHGIHHITGICGNARENLDFYVGLLGMRLVKKSVNQDDPGTYHLFYADGAGTPGTDLTFFPWSRGRRARVGWGLTVEVPMAVPVGALPYWQERLTRANVEYSEIEARFGEPTLTFTDPHGLRLSLSETADSREWVAWDESPVPSKVQVRGMHAARLWERNAGPTHDLLTGVMGFRELGSEDGWRRYGVDDAISGKLIEIRETPDAPYGAWGIGGIHHVAWRVRDEAEELALRAKVAESGLQPTPVIDRFWFKSVYFAEPGNAVFELATDGPGFQHDEELARLGEQLILPPWLESRRAEIEAALPQLPPARSDYF